MHVEATEGKRKTEAQTKKERETNLRGKGEMRERVSETRDGSRETQRETRESRGRGRESKRETERE